MSSDSTETPSASSITVSVTPNSPNTTEVTDFVGKTIRDHFFTDIKLSKEKNSWEATCTICKSTIRGSKGVTSNFNRHIKDFHTNQYEIWQDKIQQVSSTQKKITDSMAVEKIKHARVPNAMYSSNHPRQIELQKSVVEDLIVELGLPLSLVEREGFINFMNRVDPQFKMVSRRSITRTALPSLYKKMMDGLNMFCTSAECISLTLDVWSDRRQRAFFAVTGHAIINSKFKSYVLAFEPIFGNHHASLLLETYEACINTYSIQSKLVRLITDSCSNNIAAFRNLVIPGFELYFQHDDDDDDLSSDWDGDEEQSDINTEIENNVSIEIDNALNQFISSIMIEDESFRLPCYAHTLQLVINDGLKGATSVQSALEKVSKIAKLSHSSTIIAERFEKIQASIPRANKTRWNSQYVMVTNVVGIQSSDLNDILAETQHKDLCLKSSDYQILNEFISLLALFAEATTTTQAENTPSISIVAPSILAIYDDLLREQPIIKHTSSLCESLLNSFTSRFGGLLEQMLIEMKISDKNKNNRFYDLFKDPIFLIAPFLDGRFRLAWLSASVISEEMREELINKIQQMVFDQCVVLEHANRSQMVSTNDTSPISPPPSIQTTNAITASSPITSKRKSVFSNMRMQEVKKPKPDVFSYIKDEISRYISNDDDLDAMFLLKYSNNYPTLSKLAQKILCVPATSAPVERIFSQSGFLLRQHRASMTRTTLKQLTMLKCNRDLY